MKVKEIIAGVIDALALDGFNKLKWTVATLESRLVQRKAQYVTRRLERAERTQH